MRHRRNIGTQREDRYQNCRSIVVFIATTLNYQPEWDLEQGLQETIIWQKQFIIS